MERLQGYSEEVRTRAELLQRTSKIARMLLKFEDAPVTIRKAGQPTFTVNFDRLLRGVSYCCWSIYRDLDNLGFKSVADDILDNLEEEDGRNCT